MPVSVMRSKARPIPAPCTSLQSRAGGGNLVHEPKFWPLWGCSQSARHHLTSMPGVFVGNDALCSCIRQLNTLYPGMGSLLPYVGYEAHCIPGHDLLHNGMYQDMVRVVAHLLRSGEPRTVWSCWRAREVMASVRRLKVGTSRNPVSS